MALNGALAQYATKSTAPTEGAAPVAAPATVGASNLRGALAQYKNPPAPLPIPAPVAPAAPAIPAQPSGVSLFANASKNLISALPSAWNVSGSTPSTVQLPGNNPARVPAPQDQLTTISQAAPETPVGKVLSALNTFAQKIGIVSSPGETNAKSADVATLTNTINDAPYYNLGLKLGLQNTVQPTYPAGTSAADFQVPGTDPYQYKAIVDAAKAAFPGVQKQSGIETPDKVTDQFVSDNFDSITKQMGIRTMPTNAEFTGMILTGLIPEGIAGEITLGAAKLLPTLVKAGVGLAGYTALSTAEDKIVQVATGKSESASQAVTEGLNLSPAAGALLDLLDMGAKGGALYGVYKAAPSVFDAFTKDTIHKVGLPQYVYIDSAKVKDIFQTGNLTSQDEKDMITSLGLNGEQYKQAFKDGLTIEIPSESLTSITDKPYWAKIKNSLGFEPTDNTVRSTAKPGVSDRILNPNRQLPSAEDVKAKLDAGKSAASAAYELQKDMPKADAETLVKQAQELPTTAQGAPVVPEAPTAPVPTTLPSSLDESVLNKTPGEFQQDFASVGVAHDDNVAQIQSDIKDLEKAVTDAKPQSVEKKNAKVALSAAKNKLADAIQTHQSSIRAHAGALSTTLQDHLTSRHGIAPEQAREVAGKVMGHITTPALIEKYSNTPLREIATRVADEHRAATAIKRGETVTVEGKEGTVVRPTRAADGKRGFEVQVGKETKVVSEGEITKGKKEEKEPEAKKSEPKKTEKKEISEKKPGELSPEKAKELIAHVQSTGGFVSEKEVEQVREKFGNIAVIVKDVNGQRARMSIDDFEALSKHKAFSDRIRSVFMNRGSIETGIKPEFDEQFMEAIQPKKLLESGAQQPNEPFEKIDGISFTNESSITKVQQAKFVEMAKNERVRSLLKQTGIREVNIQAPYKFQLSEQAHLVKGKKIINISADATDPTRTMLHELGHAKFEDLPKSEQESLIEKAKETKNEAMQGYKSIGAWEEIVADSLYIDPKFAPDIYKGERSTEEYTPQGLSLVAKSADIEGKMPPLLSRTDMLSVYRNNPEFKKNPVLTVVDRSTSPDKTETKYTLEFDGSKTHFAINASALGLVEKNLTPGEKIRLNPADFKTAGVKEFRVIKIDEHGKETVHASMAPQDKNAPARAAAPEKPPREPKEKQVKEAPTLKQGLDPRELYNAEKAIEQNRPRGYAATVFKEVSTWFNPKGQTQTAAVDVIMRNKGEYERILFRTEQAMKAVKKMWDAHSQEVALDFMDKVETGDLDSIPPEFRALAEMYRERLTNTWKAIQEFKEVPFMENYFPHLWKDPKAVAAANVWAKANARRPFQGNKSFTKERIFATIQDGIKAGYELETHNPEELVQLHEQNVQKFLMANRIMDDLKARGFAKLVKSGGKNKVPDGFARLNDSMAKVYLNPHIPILEAYDEHVYNALSDVISSLGLEHDRKYNIGHGALGYTQRGTAKITTKFGTPLSVIAHELGHQLDYKYDLQKLFKSDPDRTYGSESDYTQKELRKLADLRYEGHDVTDSYKQYIRSAPEKMAVMLEAYVHAPEKFKEVAPRTFEKFTEFLKSHPETAPILDIKPSLVYGVREDSIYAGGLVLGGEYWVQQDVARMLNNFLSPDHIMDTALGKGIMNVKNTMNALELGFSAFHLTMETLDTMITKFSIGLTKVAHGNFRGFGDMLLSPGAPLTYFRDGQKFYNGDVELIKIENDLFTGGASLREKQYYKNTVFDTFLKTNREIFGLLTKPQFKTESAVPGTVLKPEAKYKVAPRVVKLAAQNLLRLPMAAIEATMRPLFTYYIPRLKVGAFRDLFASELLRNSQRIQDGEMTRESVARDVWNNIENRMGELNYDNLFWNRNLKSGLMLTTRAVGWNLGTVREIGGAVFQDVPKQAFNAARGKGFNFTPKMAYTLSLFFFVATLGAIYQYLHTGKKPSSVKDLFYPQNGATDTNGEPYRVEFPTYLKDVYQSGAPQLLTGHPFGAFDSFTSMLGNKASPELSTIIELMQNRDFFGNEIRNPNDNNTTQAKQVALYLGSTLTPFTLQQQQNLAAGKSTIEQQAESFFGIIKAPAAVIQSDYDAQLKAIYQNQSGLHAPRHRNSRTPTIKNRPS